MNAAPPYPHEHGGPRIRVLVVEDDPAIRESLAALVRASPSMCVSGEVDSVAGALFALRKPHDVVLVDLALPDGSGIEIVREVAKHGRARTLVITVFGDEANVLGALEAGADGYLLKDSLAIDESILQVMRGEAPMSPAIAAHLLRRWRGPAPASATGLPALAPRELQLLECLARGLSYREAAEELALSPHTVGDYVKGIYRKLSVNSRGEAVFTAMQRGLIRMPVP